MVAQNWDTLGAEIFSQGGMRSNEAQKAAMGAYAKRIASALAKKAISLDKNSDMKRVSKRSIDLALASEFPIVKGGSSKPVKIYRDEGKTFGIFEDVLRSAMDKEMSMEGDASMHLAKRTGDVINAFLKRAGQRSVDGLTRTPVEGLPPFVVKANEVVSVCEFEPSMIPVLSNQGPKNVQTKKYKDALKKWNECYPGVKFDRNHPYSKIGMINLDSGDQAAEALEVKLAADKRRK